MKILIIISILIFSLDSFACQPAGRIPASEVTEGLILDSDAIVWVEYLSFEEFETPRQQIEGMSDELFEALSLVEDHCERDKTKIYIFNELSVVQGKPITLELKYYRYASFSIFAYENLVIGQRYVLFFSAKSVIGAIAVNDTMALGIIREKVNKYMLQIRRKEASLEM